MLEEQYSSTHPRVTVEPGSVNQWMTVEQAARCQCLVHPAGLFEFSPQSLMLVSPLCMKRGECLGVC